VTGELDVVRALTESLRSQNHEAANRLHTVVSLIEMGRPEEAVDFATEELQVAQLLTDRSSRGRRPGGRALLLGKTAEAAERGIELHVTGDSRPAADGRSRDLVTVLGNLVDNALDAVDRPTTAGCRAARGRRRSSCVVVGDSGPGSPDEARARARARLDHQGSPRTRRPRVGLALVGQVARRHGGDVRIGTPSSAAPSSP
jgi:sensor histidine kinase regulating citrate/malate metabolism